jgi:hypothetical protein
MRKLVIAFLCLAATAGQALSAGESLEYKVAVISAGRYVPQNDTSVARARDLLNSVAKRYHVTQEQAADMTAVVQRELAKSGVKVNPTEVLDGAMIYGAADDSQWKLELRTYLSSYAASRASGFSHHEAVRAVVALQVSIINAGGKAPSGKTY